MWGCAASGLKLLNLPDAPAGHSGPLRTKLPTACCIHLLLMAPRTFELKALRDRFDSRGVRQLGALLISFPTPQAGQAFAKKQALHYNVNGSAEMTDLPLVRA